MSMHISYLPLRHTLLDRGWKKEDLRVKAGLTTNMIANMGKDKGINMETLARICDTLDCDITDVIMLVRGKSSGNGEKPVYNDIERTDR